MAQLDACPTGEPRWLSWKRVPLVIRRLRVLSSPGWQQSLVEIHHEIFSTVILYLLLSQEGQLLVSGKRMCTILNHSRGLSLPSKGVVR